MAKTQLDVVAMAHRRLGILATDEVPTADMDDYASDTLEALFEELQVSHGMSFTWTLATVPEAAFLPLSYLLATEIAPHYEVPSESRAKAMGRLRAYQFPDDREDSRDLDDDGTVTDAEAAAGKRAEYY